MKFRLIETGNFTRPFRVGSFVLGALLIYLPTKYVTSPVAWGICFLLGLLFMVVGGFTSWAKTLDLRPFENGYKKARDSYKTKDDKQDEPK